jgi:hypothetical protein
MISEYEIVEATWEWLMSLEVIAIPTDHYPLGVWVEHGKVHLGDLKIYSDLVNEWSIQSGENCNKKMQETMTKSNVRLETNTGYRLLPYLIERLTFCCHDVNRPDMKTNGEIIREAIAEEKFGHQPESPIMLTFYVNKDEGIARLGCYNGGHRLRGFESFRETCPELLSQALFSILLNVTEFVIENSDGGLRKSATDITGMMGYHNLKKNYLVTPYKTILRVLTQVQCHIASEKGLGRKPGSIINSGTRNNVEKIRKYSFKTEDILNRMSIILCEAVQCLPRATDIRLNKSIGLGLFCFLEKHQDESDSKLQALINDMIKSVAMSRMKECMIWASEISEAQKADIFKLIDTSIVVSGTGGARMKMITTLSAGLSIKTDFIRKEL